MAYGVDVYFFNVYAKGVDGADEGDCGVHCLGV